MGTIEPQQVLGNWIHSQEEDRDGLMVFRTRSFAFPLRRTPRRALRLHQDGRAEIGTPGPTDRSGFDSTEWRLDGDALTVAGSTPLSGRFRIVEVDASRLVLRRDDQE